jgi:NADPH-dependent curcumin reductase CurA
VQGINRQIVLAKRPVGMATPDCFEAATAEIPEPGEGQALIRVLCFSIDPAIRGWIDARGSGYMPAIEIGEPVRANGAGVVIKSRSEKMPVGTLVTALTGWQEYALAGSDMSDLMHFATPLPEGTEPEMAVTVFGQIAATAYASLVRVAPPQEGQTFLVSAAASGVGSLAGQIAKLMGARVIGLAGSEEKCRWVTEDLGFDACIDYKTEDVAARIKELAPKGVDIFFDNVGGELLDTVLRRIALHGRVVLCGSLATDNLTEPYRLRHFDRLMSRRAQMTGVNVLDHWDLFPEAIKRVGEWLETGQVKHRVFVLDGLDRAPEGLDRMYRGDHLGKIVVRVADA